MQSNVLLKLKWIGGCENASFHDNHLAELYKIVQIAILKRATQ